MPTIVGVRLRSAAKPALVDTAGLELSLDDVVVVRSDRGQELGRVASEPHEPAAGESVDGDVRLDRVATDDDLKTAEEMHRREKDALPIYRRLVQKHGLDMKPIDVEYLLDGSRMTFYFVAEERVDFRELVRDLASEFHARIDMRQVGVRDEARMIGGLGHCGEQLCCARFGGDFQPVSIRMAKEQDLPLNPLKISGLCGRLMCCLRYEFEAYKDFKGRAPRKGAIIEVGDSRGKVVDFNTPKEKVTLRMEEGGTQTFALEDMDCCSGQGCPCRVKAEALQRQAEALSASVASVATFTPTLSPAAKTEDAAAEGADGRGQGRRRRRGGSGSGGGGGEQGSGGRQQGAVRGQQASSGGQQQAAKPKGDGRKPRQRSGQAAGQAGGQPGGQAAQAAPKPPASGESSGSGSGRRRRRRRSSGGGGASEGGAGASA